MISSRATNVAAGLALFLLSGNLAFSQTTTPKFVYVVSDFVEGTPACSGNFIAGHTVDANTGVLARMPGSPFLSPGVEASHIASDPLGRFLWVVNRPVACTGANSITALRIDPATGIPTPAGPPMSSGGSSASWLVTDPAGKYAFVANACVSDTNCVQGSISVFSINQTTGTLTPIAGSPFLSQIALPRSLATDPAGRFLFVAGGSAAVTFSIDAVTGAIAPVAGPVPAQGVDQRIILVDSSGRFAVSINRSDSSSLASIASWLLGPGGALTPAGAVPPQGSGEWAVAIHPDGRNVYSAECVAPAACFQENRVAQWSLDQVTGSLTAAPGSPFGSQGAFLFSLAADPSGKFLFGAHEQKDESCSEGVVAAFTIGANGGLTPAPGSPFANLPMSPKSMTAVGQRHAGPANPVAVQVQPSSASIAAGLSYQFMASATLSDSTIAFLSASAVWSSSDPSVAVVSSTGVAIGLAPGSAVITSCSGTLCGSSTLTVTPGAPPSTTLSPTAVDFGAQGTGAPAPARSVTLRAAAFLPDLRIRIAGPHAPDFSQTNNCGTELLPGASCTINVGFTPGADGNRAATLEVLDGCRRVAAVALLRGAGFSTLVSIAVTPSPATVAAGTTRQFTAIGTYVGGATQNITSSVTWTSSDPTIATINTAGLATGVKAGGPVGIQARSGTVVSNSAPLSVTAPVLVSIAVTPPSANVFVAGTRQFTATGTYSDGSTQDVTTAATWTSVVPAIATINGSGLATGVAAGGPVGIRAALGTITSNTAQLTVVSPVLLSIAVTPASATIIIGRTRQFTATGTYSDASTRDLTSQVTWNSSLPAVAPVGPTGTVFGVAIGGPVAIYVNVGSLFSGAAMVTVAPSPVANVLSWGGNNKGALGNGTLVLSRNTPGPVADLNSIIGVTGSAANGLAVDSGGSVFAWGDNVSGQLGVGNRVPTLTAVRVPLAGMVSASSGLAHGMTLQSNGTVFAFGNNSQGQLGLGLSLVPFSFENPLLVPGLTGIVAISAGAGHSLALKSDGTVWAWGNGDLGQVGNGLFGGAAAPVPVSVLTGVVVVAAGYNSSFALKSDGTVWAWGQNTEGGLGDGSNVNRNAPVRVQNLTGVIAIAAGGFHGLALKSDGTVWSWGFNSYGQLGNGAGTNSNTAVPVTGATGIVGVAAGYSHSLALKSDGTVLAWGYNGAGALGNGGNANSSLPVPVPGLTNVLAIAAGPTSESSFAITSARTLVSISITPSAALLMAGSSRQLSATGFYSDGSTQDLTAQAEWTSSGTATVTTSGGLVTGLQPGKARIRASVAGLASQTAHITVARSGTVLAWGSGSSGQLGNGLNAGGSTPIPLTAPPGFVAVATSENHSLGLRSDGTVFAWGDNTTGQLGIGSFASSNVPVPVPGLTGIVAIAAGSPPSTGLGAGPGHSVALKSDGSVWTWGHNLYGQLGVGNTADSNIPVRVPNLFPVVAVAAGPQNTFVITDGGRVFAWGRNDNGQLGNGSKASSSIPVGVPALTGVWAVAAGTSHTLASRSDGSVVAWGANSAGQLGIAAAGDYPVPLPVPDLSFLDITDVNAGGSSSVALQADGSVWTWGANDFGQLGNGTTANSNTPGKLAAIGGVTAIGGGRSHFHALRADGTLWAWGRGDFYNLGDGDVNPLGLSRSLPAQVSNVAGVVALGRSSTAQHGLAITTAPIVRLTTAASPAVAGAVNPNTRLFTAGGTVTITASPQPGYLFTGFSGALSGAANPQTLTLTADTSVTANFAPAQPSLTASVGTRSDGAISGTRVVPIALLNSGQAAATNAAITSITAITVLTGTGAVSVSTAMPVNLGSLAISASKSADLLFAWPATATRVRFTVNFTADGGYSGSTTITAFR